MLQSVAMNTRTVIRWAGAALVVVVLSLSDRPAGASGDNGGYVTVPPPTTVPDSPPTKEIPPPPADEHIPTVTDHGPPVITRASDLAFTGDSRTTVLILVGVGALVAGLVLLVTRRRMVRAA